MSRVGCCICPWMAADTGRCLCVDELRVQWAHKRVRRRRVGALRGSCGWKKGLQCWPPFSCRTPAAHGGFLAPQFSPGDARAEPPVLGPGALGVTETQPGPQSSGRCWHQPFPEDHQSGAPEPSLCAVDSVVSRGDTRPFLPRCLGLRALDTRPRELEGTHWTAQKNLGVQPGTPASISLQPCWLPLTCQESHWTLDTKYWAPTN